MCFVVLVSVEKPRKEYVQLGSELLPNISAVTTATYICTYTETQWQSFIHKNQLVKR